MIWDGYARSWRGGSFITAECRIPIAVLTRRKGLTVQLPQARGPLTECLLAQLQTHSRAAELDDARALTTRALADTADILYDEDLQLALFCLYELHYSGLAGVDDDWEWSPPLLELRHEIEVAFESRLRVGSAELSRRAAAPSTAHEVAEVLFAMVAGDDSPSVADFIARKADTGQLRELVVHKSVYQLKEADPHTWAIPRLTHRPKAALVEIQADEYGGGQLDQMHSAMFATTMSELGLDNDFGAYVDWVPALPLATVNLMSLFGLHRRLRGAIVGHLAIYEMGSSLPSRKYARGLRRLGFDAPAASYFDEHVEADAVHEQIAGRDLAGGLVEQDPSLMPDVVFGAASALFVGGLLDQWQLAAWNSGSSSLRRPLPALEDASPSRHSA